MFGSRPPRFRRWAACGSGGSRSPPNFGRHQLPPGRRPLGCSRVRRIASPAATSATAWTFANGGVGAFGSPPGDGYPVRSPVGQRALVLAPVPVIEPPPSTIAVVPVGLSIGMTWMCRVFTDFAVAVVQVRRHAYRTQEVDDEVLGDQVLTSAAIHSRAWTPPRNHHRGRARRVVTELMREYDVQYYPVQREGSPIWISELHRHRLASQPAMSRLVTGWPVRGSLRWQVSTDGQCVRLSLHRLRPVVFSSWLRLKPYRDVARTHQRLSLSGNP